MNYKKEFVYVKESLLKTNGELSRRKTETFRKRSEHSRNVFNWCLRIYNELDENTKKTISLESVLYSAIFHDVGYGLETFHNSHPLQRANIWRRDSLIIPYEIYILEVK